MQIALITGLSGSGKSVALPVLEDHGFYCVHNLPVRVMPPLVPAPPVPGPVRVAIGLQLADAPTPGFPAAPRSPATGPGPTYSCAKR